MFGPRPRALATVFAGALWCAGAMAGGNLVQPDPQNASAQIMTLWDDRMLPMTWVFSSDGYPGSGLTNAQVVAEFQAAFDTIETVSSSRLDFTYGGEVDRRSGKLDGPLGGGIDGYNLVSFTDPDFVFPPGVVGISLASFFTADLTIDSGNSDLDGDGAPDIPEGVYPAGTIFDNDILFNSSLDYQISGVNGSADIRSIALHEIGHLTGLSHSSVRDAVMWPFLGFEIAQTRTLKSDDIGYLSLHYPRQPDFSDGFGIVSGRVSNGFNGVRVLGAHVYAVDPVTGVTVAGAFSLNDGGYTLPVPAGDYLIAMEPLDGDPVGLDPERINRVVEFTFDTDFPEEFYDANEANIEADAQAALLVSVAPGASVTDIDLVTNTLEVPGVSRVFREGRNYFAYPVAVPAGLTAYDLLQALGTDTEVTGLERYDTGSGVFQRAQYAGGGPGGVDFPVARGDGLIVHMLGQKAVTFAGTPDCPDLDLAEGLNLKGVPCPPAAYSAHDLLENLGADYEVAHVQRYDPDTGTFQVAQYAAGVPAGDDFAIVNGESYIARMNVAKQGVAVPGQGQLFPPALTGLSPGSAVRGATVLLLGQGFDPQAGNNLVVFNGVGAQVLFATPTVLTVKVPFTATTGPVTVTVDGKQSNALPFLVQSDTVQEDPAGNTPLVSGQTAQGSLSTQIEQDRYVFTALAGSVATIEARSVTPGVPDMLLVLEGPGGVALTSDDDGGGGSNARINNFKLPQTGQYTIVVTSVPGTGTGPYTLTLDVSTSTTASKISVLEGNSQSALAGTTLPVPVKIFVTGPNGAALAGVPVTFVASSTDFSVPTGSAMTAGSATITSNGSGVVVVEVTLSSTPDVYQLDISGPGINATTMLVSALSADVATVQITGNNQDCGGNGCPVGQLLPEPFSMTFRDVNGTPVEGVLSGWKTLSGGGVTGSGSPPFSTVDSTGAFVHETDASGVLSVDFLMGPKLYRDGTLERIPHTVAATIPGQVAPALFSALATAGDPAKLESNKSNFSRLTIGTSALNAIRLRVLDAFDNPVENATVSLNAGNGLTAGPGILDGVFLTDFNTNAAGTWVGRVSAGVATVMPTIDEFGGGMGGPYTVTAQVGGLAPAVYNVQVDMGPAMVTWSVQGDSQTITRDLASPVAKRVFRYQRLDTFDDDGNGQDADKGDWRDEDYSVIRLVPIPDVDVMLSIRRDDNEDLAGMGLTPTRMEGMDERTVTTDSGGFAETDVTMGDVGGVVNVIGRIPTMTVEYRNDIGFHPGQDGLLLHDPALMDNPRTIPAEDQYGESTVLNAVPVVLTITLDDRQGITEPALDPYPGIPSVSGVDLSTVTITLNPDDSGVLLFNGPLNLPFSLGDFPYFRSVLLDGVAVSAWPDSTPGQDYGAGTVTLIYYPDGSQLVPGQNEVRIDGPYQDHAGNLNDQAPDPVILNFDFN